MSEIKTAKRGLRLHQGIGEKDDTEELSLLRHSVGIRSVRPTQGDHRVRARAREQGSRRLPRPQERTRPPLRQGIRGQGRGVPGSGGYREPGVRRPWLSEHRRSTGHRVSDPATGKPVSDPRRLPLQRLPPGGDLRTEVGVHADGRRSAGADRASLLPVAPGLPGPGWQAGRHAGVRSGRHRRLAQRLAAARERRCDPEVPGGCLANQQGTLTQRGTDSSVPPRAEYFS